MIVRSGSDQEEAARALLCREITREHSKTFYRASQMLGPRRRRAIHAAYAFCRHADDLADARGAMDEQLVAALLNEWEEQIDRPTDAVAVEFARAREEFGIPPQPARDLVRGVRMDLSPVRFTTWDELHEYCYLVAGTVGLMTAPVLGCRDEDALPQAAQLGIAMQLTNILRDVAEDAIGGRVYLPLDELRAFGCCESDLLARRTSQALAELVRFQVARARSLYAEAARGLPALCPSGRLAATTALHFYAGILTEIERREYDVLSGRAIVSAGRKLRLMPRIAWMMAPVPFVPRSQAGRAA